MQSLKAETDENTKMADRYDRQAKELNDAADKNDALLRDIGKKIAAAEASLDDTLAKYTKCSSSLEEKEKASADAEDEVNGIARKVVLMEVEAKEADIKVGEVVKDLALKSKEADVILKKVRYFESKNMNNEVAMEELEKDLREANRIVSDSDKKLDETTRKFGMMEEELKRALERAEAADNKVKSLEEDLKNIGENMKQLEVSAEKALVREEKYKDQIKQIIERLKQADARSEYGEMHITKLNIRIDELEDEIVREKLKIKKLGDEMGDTLDEMLAKY